MKDKIVNALNQVETDQNCQILFACESGSRAWGFASPDSDYDVRFIYCHPLNWYLKIDNAPDTIDLMLPDDLDLCGWELKKTMTLFAKSNICLFEWINSPEIYFSNANFHKALQDLIADYFNPKKALYHYLSTAINIKKEYFKPTQVNIKKCFYVIRPLLACCWILNHNTMPPTAFYKLYSDNTTHLSSIRNEINALLLEKSHASESNVTQLSAELISWIETTITNIENAIKVTAANKTTSLEPLNEIIYATIL